MKAEWIRPDGDFCIIHSYAFNCCIYSAKNKECNELSKQDVFSLNEFSVSRILESPSFFSFF